MAKAQAYADLRKPFCVNDLRKQVCVLVLVCVCASCCGVFLERERGISSSSPKKHPINKPKNKTKKNKKKPIIKDALQDRRLVYSILKEAGVPVPRHIIVSRDGLTPGAGVGGADPPGFIEEDDYVELGGVRIEKPFVEKPASGEDHNIYIYYPMSMVRALVCCRCVLCCVLRCC